MTLRFDGSSGRETNLQHIASLLGTTRLLYSNCERMSGLAITSCRVRLSQAAPPALVAGWLGRRTAF